MLRVILGVFAAVTSLQTRARYHVLDPFSSNGLWTDVSSNTENDAPQAMLQINSDQETSGAMNVVERKEEMRASKPRTSQPAQSNIRKSQEEMRKRDEREVAEVVHHYRTESSLPYLPDLTALKQITDAGPASPVTLSNALAHGQLKAQARTQGEGKKKSSKQNQVQRSSKRHLRRKSPHSESSQPNVAPPMPQLPSLAAATDAPLPPEYPRWDSSPPKASQSPPTSLLEMDSSSGAHLPGEFPESSLTRFRYLSDSPDAFAAAKKRSGARAPWPSDVSPPSDYFLPPEILI